MRSFPSTESCILLCLLLTWTGVHAGKGATKPLCGMEGAKCAMQRDCCDAHECVEGDWAQSTDFSCKRVGPKPAPEEYVERLRALYADVDPALGDPGKASDAAWLHHTLRKWQGREEELIVTLQAKYFNKDGSPKKGEL